MDCVEINVTYTPATLTIISRVDLFFLPTCRVVRAYYAYVRAPFWILVVSSNRARAANRCRTRGTSIIQKLNMTIGVSMERACLAYSCRNGREGD